MAFSVIATALKSMPFLLKAGKLASKLPKAVGTGSKFAGRGLQGLTKGMSKGEMVGRFAPDLLGGVISASALPANASFGDRLLTGTVDTVLPATLGLGASRLPGVRNNPWLSSGLDTVGSYGGAYAAMPLSDSMLRTSNQMFGTGEYKNPWERLSEQQQREQYERMQQEILLGYGLIPGTRPNEMMSSLSYG